jgi:hypothetical protein
MLMLIKNIQICHENDLVALFLLNMTNVKEYTVLRGFFVEGLQFLDWIRSFFCDVRSRLNPIWTVLATL